jgi:hypothetical protein
VILLLQVFHPRIFFPSASIVALPLCAHVRDSVTRMKYVDYQFKDEINAPDLKNIPRADQSVRRVENFAV